jgi:NADH dehydrogenase FAD-containing subunit
MSQTLNSTVILGGGFVGLFAALHLSHQNYPHSIVLIDSRRTFSFKPLLYELLSGEMHCEQVCPPYEDLLVGSSVNFVQDAIQSIDLHKRRVILDSGKTYYYSNLVLALGGKTTYFDTPGAAEYALPFTSADEAIALSHHIKDNLNKAAQTKDPEARKQLLTVAIIGAGPAGVELACTLADLMPIWCTEAGVDSAELRLVLVNRSDEILKGDINSRLRDTAKAALQNRTTPVELLLDTAVTGISADGLEYTKQDQMHFLPAKAIAWTAGTEPAPLLRDLPIPSAHKDKRGRLQVTPTLQLPDFPEVFVGGDCAYIDTNPQPATAQAAYQQGTAIANNLKALAQGNALSPARITMRGTLMKLGLGEGVANLFDRLEVKGKAGHLIREATYLELLPTPARNLKVTTEWLTDEIFRRHQPQIAVPDDQIEIEDDLGRPEHKGLLSGIVAIAAGLILTLPLTLRAASPQQFHQNFGWSGLPVLLDRLAPSPPPNSNS